MILNFKKQIYAVLTAAIMGMTNPLFAMECHKDSYLTPEELTQKANESFERMARWCESDWSLYNGSEIYNLCRLNEHKVLKSIIMNNPDRKEFYALDIGAGKFQWGRGLVNFLQSQTDLPEGITVHIFGIRGEEHYKQKSEFPQEENSPFKVYELGGFKIEDMNLAFLDKGFDLRNKIDLIVSHYTLRHLVNPAFTLWEAYGLSRAGTGIMLFDGFYFLQGNAENPCQIKDPINKIRTNLTSFILSFEDPFLILPTHSPEQNHYMIKKSHNHKKFIPLTVKGGFHSSEIGRSFNISSSCMTIVNDFPLTRDIPELITYYNTNSKTFYGNKILFDEVISDKLYLECYEPSFIQFPLWISLKLMDIQTIQQDELDPIDPQDLLNVIRKKNEKIIELEAEGKQEKEKLENIISEERKKYYADSDKFYDRDNENHKKTLKILDENHQIWLKNNKLEQENRQLERELEALRKEKSEVLEKQNNPENENCILM